MQIWEAPAWVASPCSVDILHILSVDWRAAAFTGRASSTNSQAAEMIGQ